MGTTSDATLIAILKGDEDAAKNYFRTYAQRENNPAPNFSYFFENYLIEHKLKKSDVIRKSQIEKGHAYKILRGDERTNRNYIIRLCLAAGMNLRNMQFALQSNGMSLLTRRDHRDLIIILGIKNHETIETIHEWLLKAGKKELIRKKD